MDSKRTDIIKKEFEDYSKNSRIHLDKSSFQQEMHFISYFIHKKNPHKNNEIDQMIESNFSMVELIKLLSSNETSSLILRILSYLIIINKENIRLIYEANGIYNIALCTNSTNSEIKTMATIILTHLLELPEAGELYLSHGVPALISLLEDEDEQQRKITFGGLEHLFLTIPDRSLIPKYLIKMNTLSIGRQNDGILYSLSLSPIQREQKSKQNIECSLLDKQIIALIDFFIKMTINHNKQYIDIIPALNECLQNSNDKIISKATEALAVLLSKRQDQKNNETDAQQPQTNKKTHVAETDAQQTQTNKRTRVASAAFFQPENTFKTKWELELERELQLQLEMELQLKLSYTARHYGYDKVNVLGDGNCFFHAVSYHLVQNPHLLANVSREAQDLRLLALDYISQNRNEYEPKFSDGGFDIYLSAAQSHSYWADEYLINALSRTLNLNLIVYSTDINRTFVIYKQQEALSTVFLLNHSNRHFYATQKNSSITPIGSLEELLNNAPADEFTATNTSMIDQSRI